MFSPELQKTLAREKSRALAALPSSFALQIENPIRGLAVLANGLLARTFRPRKTFGPALHSNCSFFLRQGPRSTLRSRCTLARYATRIYALTPGKTQSFSRRYSQLRLL
jgi:hypothetical protein